MLVLLALLVSVSKPAPHIEELAPALARADALYARRGEGALGPVANVGPIDAAIAGYRYALEIDRTSLEARIGLMRAIYFRAGFCDTPVPVQARLFEEAKRLADETVQQLERSLGFPKGAARTQALRKVPGAAEAYFWAAVSWGQWSVDHKLAAAWQGAAVKIRDLSQTVIDLDPTTYEGSGYLILGRLHAEAPKIPMLTHWISRTLAIAYLRKALEIGPDNTPNMFFLADALLTYEPSDAPQARQLLERCARAQPRAEFDIEDRHYARMAEERLSSLH